MTPRDRRKPTSELDLHLLILRRRPDVGAVVHLRPPAGEGFTPLCYWSLSSLHAARILCDARVLGRVTALDPGAVVQREALRARSPRERDV